MKALFFAPSLNSPWIEIRVGISIAAVRYENFNSDFMGTLFNEYPRYEDTIYPGEAASNGG